jgi:hypothetical protein
VWPPVTLPLRPIGCIRLSGLQGVAAGAVADFALENAIAPYEMVDDLPRQEPKLEVFQRRLNENGNPTSFPDTSIFNEDWDDWQ